jgi:hypothetical protein
MIQYFSACQDVTKIRQTFIVHGENEAQIAMKEHLHEAGFRHIHIPEKGEEMVL